MVRFLGDITEKESAVLSTADKGVPNGVAALDPNGKLAPGQEQVKITVADQAPANPAVGDVWIDTSA